MRGSLTSAASRQTYPESENARRSQTPIAPAGLQPSGSVRRAVVLRLGAISLRIDRRSIVVGFLLLAAVIGLAVLGLYLGRPQEGAVGAVKAIWGDGSEQLVRSVQQRRLPRFLTACAVGGSLAAAGSLFQSLTRNPLGSPDVIGFTAGAAAAAAIHIAFFTSTVWTTGLFAVLGGMAAALGVYLLARRSSRTGGLRLVLMGIGTAALLTAVTDAVIVRADFSDAQALQQWTAGSLTGRGWSHVVLTFGTALALLPALIPLARRLSVLELGEEAAASLGVRVERLRLTTLIVAVILVGTAVAAVGPIAFIALAAPQIARGLARSTQVGIFLPSLCGAFLLSGADLLSQELEIGLQTPVGLVTSVLGGLYLLWLLARRL
ncbi:MAG: FecCD family ABC transporter permease [Brevibacterium aurantiacum]|uniref:FecCD family ABC transporter permease n=1 Tax=Brevibacterium aurantiacum TaxID=273384 RepID=UPI00186848AE|nr:iron chelate uptake ABC transporter family permease subunit [Brevibacterium aurantiacum]